MNQKPRNPQSEKGLVAPADEVWEKIMKNKSDEQEGTFCYKLFEICDFDEKLFLELCRDMNYVLDNKSRSAASYEVLIWIITNIFRCVFSHYDPTDLYKIKNFDKQMSSRWGGQYFEELKDILLKVFATLAKGN